MPVNRKAASHFLSVELFFLWCLILDQSSWRESAMLSRSPVRCPNPSCLQTHSLRYVISLPLLSRQPCVVIATCCQQVTTRGKKKGRHQCWQKWSSEGYSWQGRMFVICRVFWLSVVSQSLCQCVYVSLWVCVCVCKSASCLLSDLVFFLTFCLCVCVSLFCVFRYSFACISEIIYAYMHIQTDLLLIGCPLVVCMCVTSFQKPSMNQGLVFFIT